MKRDTAAQRAEVIGKFVQIAEECLLLNNFNICFAIVCGLQNSSISRLKQTWEKVTKKDMKIYSKLLDLFSLNKNYKNYREALNAAQVPLIPYLGESSSMIPLVCSSLILTSICSGVPEGHLRH